MASDISVRPMTAAEYELWQPRAIANFAADSSRASGAALEEAVVLANTTFHTLLPQGLDSERSWLLVILDHDGTEVGTLWIGPQRDRSDAAYVFEIEIHEPHRGRGIGRAAMLLAEKVVAQAGMTELGLNVFGFNETARHLYDSLGYHVVATAMTKTIA
jgi:ribosomal protein S18 acetylase RimI-like enzyme